MVAKSVNCTAFIFVKDCEHLSFSYLNSQIGRPGPLCL